MSQNIGESKVYFKITGQAGAKIIETAFRVNNSDALRGYLDKELGEAITIAG
jgi:hypothetical protein